MKARYYTLGCKLNQAETAQIKTVLDSGGIAVSSTNNDDNPDVILVNTCAVTGKAAAKSRHAVARLAKAHPESILIVTGCMAQLHSSSVAEIPGVDYVLGMNARFSTRWWQGKPGQVVIDVSPDPLKDEAFSAVNRYERSRPFLKIQDGCDQHCTYCIIPHLRGDCRSRSVDSVIEAVEELISNGAEEIVLTGVRIGSWGKDLPGSENLSDLMEKATRLKGLLRIRLGSLEPWELDSRLVDFIANHPQVCPHLHIPLQHTSPSLLERMGRPSLDGVIDKISKIKMLNKDTCIGTDLIVGFPGETDAEFERMLDDINEIPLSYIHPFSFSARPGTPAEKMDPQIPVEVVKERMTAMSNLAADIRRQFAESQVGLTKTVIPDKVLDGEDWVNAVSDNYLKIRLPAAKIRSRSSLKVIISGFSSGFLSGLPI